MRENMTQREREREGVRKREKGGAMYPSIWSLAYYEAKSSMGISRFIPVCVCGVSQDCKT